MKIGTVSGWWSTNIGNSFFQLAAEFILRKSGHQIISIPDFPGYYNVKTGNPKFSLDILSKLDLDWIVLHGPIFRKEYDRIVFDEIRKFKSNGGKIACLSAGMMHYDKNTMTYYKRWLEEVPFDFITTRDLASYEFLKYVNPAVYNGIDIAFFCNELYPKVKLDRAPFVVFNFDQINEPYIEPSIGHSDFFWRGEKFQIRHWQKDEPKTILNKLKPFYMAFIRNSYQEKFNDLDIIRTDHRFNPYLSRKIYKAPNSFSSDVPFGYFLLYGNSIVTFTNRVHACVATLSYGNEAMYFSNSKRAGLLERVGLKSIYDQPASLDVDYLQSEKSMLLDFIFNSL